MQRRACRSSLRSLFDLRQPIHSGDADRLLRADTAIGLPLQFLLLPVGCFPGIAE